MFFLPRDFWVSVAKEANRYYKQKLPERMQKTFESQTGLNKLTLEQIYANERRVHSDISPKPRCGRGIQMRPPGKKAGNAGEASTEGGAASEGEIAGDDEGSSDGGTTAE
ncbi:hypothetical protein PInf_023107 [Phytophthora infestans]|nr:hypothetical protein PInf_023107 [Phytophthora infestans]